MPVDIPVEVDTETALLLAVLETLRAEVEGLRDEEVRIEYDEYPPAGFRHRMVLIMPAGVTPGPAHDGETGFTTDELVAINVCVIVEVAGIQRDRLGSKFIDGLSSLNAIVSRIRDAIEPPDTDGKFFSVMARANALLDVENTGQGFNTRLSWQGQDAKPQAVGGEYFGETPGRTGRVGLKKVIHFGGARRTRKRA